MAITNKYKNTLENFVDSSDIEPLIMSRQVDKKICNIMLGCENPPIEPKLDKNILDGS